MQIYNYENIFTNWIVGKRIIIKRVLLFYPPIGLFQRGEDRCQINVEGSTSNSVRACNDLGYMAAILRDRGYQVFLKDYPIEKADWESFEADIKEFSPNYAVMSITTPTLLKDMSAFKLLKEINPQVITIAKGAHFITTSEKLEDESFKYMDYAMIGESEFVIQDLFTAFENGCKMDSVLGIYHWNEDKSEFVSTGIPPFREDLDSLPFPARDLMRNELYTSPDSGEILATITASRGCPSSCIYCLTPSVSGRKIRYRSVENVIAEIKECIEKYNITNFFFKADTFTYKKEWVDSLCRRIIEEKLNISFVANSRVKPLDKETLSLMKKAGCWLVAFGIESGSDESLKLMKKGITTAEVRQAIKWCKEVGIKTFGYYLLGFPWEDEKMVKQTVKFAKEIDCDFVEFHIITPYEGTELYEQIKDSELYHNVIGHDSFLNPSIKTDFLTEQDLKDLRNYAIKQIYLSPKYIIRTLLGIKSLKEFFNYAKYGFKMLKNMFK